MEVFTNSILPPEDLPEIDVQSFTQLDKKYLKILFLRLTLFYVLLIGGFIALVFFSEQAIPKISRLSIAAAIGVLLIYTIIITLVGFPRKGYLVRENDISFQKGIITYKLTTVPFNRIQHVEVNQGVLAKLFKLSSLKLFTAGGNASDLSIHGLPQDVALRLKDFLSEKISEHE